MNTRILPILILLLIAGPSFSQETTQQNICDIITTYEGDEISAIVLFVNDTEIQYKKASNPDGPTYSIKKDGVFMIKYKNGDKDVFKKKNTPSSDMT